MKYLSIHFDITQRKLDETALSDEKQRWQVTLQSINDAVIVTNSRNRVTYLNPTAESLLGIALEEAVSTPAERRCCSSNQMSGEEEPGLLPVVPASPPHGRTGSAQTADPAWASRSGHQLTVVHR